MFAIRHIFVLCLVLACPAWASAQLRFTQTSVDLGELRGGPVCHHRFDFVNDSTQPIEIIDIRLGCGCLQSVLEKRVFAAGEKGSLGLNIRTLGQPNGARTWQAHVQYRQGAQVRETTLILAAVIRNEITIEPSILAMTFETALKQEITIADHRPMPSKLKAVLASSPAIRVTTQPATNGVTRVLLEVNAANLSCGPAGGNAQHLLRRPVLSRTASADHPGESKSAHGDRIARAGRNHRRRFANRALTRQRRQGRAHRESGGESARHQMHLGGGPRQRRHAQNQLGCVHGIQFATAYDRSFDGTDGRDRGHSGRSAQGLTFANFLTSRRRQFR